MKNMLGAVAICVLAGCAAAPVVDMSQLAALDVDPALKHFLVSMFEEVNQLRNSKELMQAEMNELRGSKEALQRHSKERFAALEGAHYDYGLLNKTTVLLRAGFQKVTLRLDKCETETTPFVQQIERRRMQDMEALCRGSGMTAMLVACCSSHGGGGGGSTSTGNGHRRGLQMDQGCDVLPATCSMGCAPLFNAYFAGCQPTVEALSPEMRQQFGEFFTVCTEVEQQTAAATAGARPAQIFTMVLVNPEAAQQQALFNAGSGSGPSPPFGPVVLPLPGPPPPSHPAGTGASGAGALHEFQRVCSMENLTTCAPPCNQVTDGFMLNTLIDGRGTL